MRTSPRFEKARKDAADEMEHVYADVLPQIPDEEHGPLRNMLAVLSRKMLENESLIEALSDEVDRLNVRVAHLESRA